MRHGGNGHSLNWKWGGDVARMVLRGWASILGRKDMQKLN